MLATILAGFGLWATATGLLPRVTWFPLAFMIPAVAVRRVVPTLGLALAWASAAAQLQTGLDVSFLQVGTAVVLYSSAVYGRRWLVVFSGISAIAGSVIAVLYLVQTLSWTSAILRHLGSSYPHRVLVFALLPLSVLGGAWLAGLAVRALRRSAVATQARVAAETDARRSGELVMVANDKAELARDVHDVVGHSLAVIIAQADSVRFIDQSDPDAVRRTVATIAETARRSLGEVRQVLNDIEAVDTNGIDIRPDLDAVVRNVAASGAAVEDIVTGKPLDLGHDGTEAAHRVLQEGLTNALKFSDRAWPIFVFRQWTNDALNLGIRNHVAAGGAPRVGDFAGSGLDGMRSRLARIGGSLEIVTPIEAGSPTFAMVARIPAARLPAAARS